MRSIAESWATRPVWLKFEFGEFQLFTVRFQLMVLDVHFTELGDDPSATWPGWNSVPAGVEGALVRSHPASTELPVLRVSEDVIQYIPAQYHRHFTDLRGTFDSYIKTHSRKSMRERNRELSRFERHSGGSVDFRSYRTTVEVDEFLQLAIPLAKRTFQTRLLGVGLPDTEKSIAHIRSLAARDRIRGYLLFHGGQPVSYLLNEVRDNGIVIGLYTGYDPEFRKFSVGTLVWFKALESLFAEGGLRMMDYTEGEGTHKQYFGTGSQRCVDVYFLRRTLRVRVLLAIHMRLEALSKWIVSTLDRLGLKARVKKLIRRRA